MKVSFCRIRCTRDGIVIHKMVKAYIFLLRLLLNRLSASVALAIRIYLSIAIVNNMLTCVQYDRKSDIYFIASPAVAIGVETNPYALK